MSAVVCCECSATFAGSRFDAQRIGRWEPYSHNTQRDVDHGPLVCAECIRRLLDELLSKLLAARAGRR
ncbi:hypothetical protein [uncultured Aeromicrobium sp.]|uniref:hypothetical protein n=1 Tax=uncultured Aeromicrobium sp. TaxID=337820 RepID=UPI0025DA386C|nr:hypothetical protein [uncultured Aeromicrobium sp.]